MNLDTTKGRKAVDVGKAEGVSDLDRLVQVESGEGVTDPAHLLQDASDVIPPAAYGRHLNPAALGRRYNRARDVAGLRPLRWHDLRHTFGSLLVAAGVDTVSVKAAMGHERITTTERYLHARPATQQAAAFTKAFGLTTHDEPAEERLDR